MSVKNQDSTPQNDTVDHLIFSNDVAIQFQNSTTLLLILCAITLLWFLSPDASSATKNINDKSTTEPEIPFSTSKKCEPAAGDSSP
jgi:hypothetical protein